MWNFVQGKIFLLWLCTKSFKHIFHCYHNKVLLRSHKLLISNSSNHNLSADLPFVICLLLSIILLDFCHFCSTENIFRWKDIQPMSPNKMKISSIKIALSSIFQVIYCYYIVCKGVPAPLFKASTPWPSMPPSLFKIFVSPPLFSVLPSFKVF